MVTVTTLPQSIGGVRGLRRTEIHRADDGARLTEVLTDWVWVRELRWTTDAGPCGAARGLPSVAMVDRLSAVRRCTTSARAPT